MGDAKTDQSNESSKPSDSTQDLPDKQLTDGDAEAVKGGTRGAELKKTMLTYGTSSS